MSRPKKLFDESDPLKIIPYLSETEKQYYKNVLAEASRNYEGCSLALRAQYAYASLLHYRVTSEYERRIYERERQACRMKRMENLISRLNRLWDMLLNDYNMPVLKPTANQEASLCLGDLKRRHIDPTQLVEDSELDFYERYMDMLESPEGQKALKEDYEKIQATVKSGA